MEKIQAEVRLYYTGRTSWETEYFTASSLMDVQIQATKIAKERQASHFNFGLATPEENIQENRRLTSKVFGANIPVKDQVKAIEGALGLRTEDDSD
jgi:hypothetical protein